MHDASARGCRSPSASASSSTEWEPSSSITASDLARCEAVCRSTNTVANRLLTLVQNLALGTKLSEYHTGYRAFSKDVLQTLPLDRNSNDFVFDNEMLTQAIAAGFRIGEVSCPTKYFPEGSSVSFRRAVTYGFGVLRNCLLYRLWKRGLAKPPLFIVTAPREARPVP